MRILNSKKLCVQESSIAQFYLERFVLAAQHIYGYSSQSMNMHLLSHLVDDTRRFRRPLDEISAFPCENLLGKIKRRLKSGFKPLEKTCRTILEEELLEFDQPKNSKTFEVLSFTKHDDDFFVIKKLKYHNFTITSKPPNNVVSLKDSRLVIINNIFIKSKNFEHLEQINVEGKMLELDGTAFTYPTDSSLLDMHKVKKTDLDLKSTFAEIESKVILFNVFEKLSQEQQSNNLYVIPFLHYDKL